MAMPGSSNLWTLAPFLLVPAIAVWRWYSTRRLERQVAQVVARLESDHPSSPALPPVRHDADETAVAFTLNLRLESNRLMLHNIGSQLARSIRLTGLELTETTRLEFGVPDELAPGTSHAVSAHLHDLAVLRDEGQPGPRVNLLDALRSLPYATVNKLHLSYDDPDGRRHERRFALFVDPDTGFPGLLGVGVREPRPRPRPGPRPLTAAVRPAGPDESLRVRSAPDRA